MLFTVICIVGLLACLAGRLLFERYYNHLTIYSLFWTASLAFYTFRLIEYHTIMSEALIYIALGWVMLFVGSITVIFAVAGQEDPIHFQIEPRGVQPTYSTSLKLLSNIIVFLCTLSVIGIILKLLSVLQTFGSVGSALINASLLYRMRVEGEFTSIPYLGSFPLAASCLAGLYTALRRKLTYLTYVPFFLVGLHGLVVMGRTDIMIAGALFLSAYFYTPHKKFITRRTFLALVLMIILTFGTFTVISSIRGLTARFNHETQEMSKLRSTIIFLPSIYFYLTAPPVAFSEYLYLDEEKVSPGSYTFKSVYNILTKMDLAEPLPTYNPFIRTPEPINAGTYLREIHADFGPAGILVVPFIIGVFLTAMILRVKRKPNAFWIILLSHFFVIIWLSWDINAMKLGQWVVSLFVCILIAWRLDSKQQDSNALQRGAP